MEKNRRALTWNLDLTTNFLIYVNKFSKNMICKQGSTSGTESQGSRGPGSGNLGPGLEPGLILKSGTGTGTHFRIRDCDRDSNSKFSGSGTRTGTETWKIQDPGLTIFHPGPRFARRGIPGLNFGGPSRGIKNSGDWKFSVTRSRSRADPCPNFKGLSLPSIGNHFQVNFSIKLTVISA